MPGMVDVRGVRIAAVKKKRDEPWNALHGYEVDALMPLGHVEGDALDIMAEPDLTDPATLGCLLALVREAWGPVVWWEPDHRCDGLGRLCVYDSEGVCQYVWDNGTEAEALVAALEATP